MSQEISQESKTRRSAILHQQAFSSALGTIVRERLPTGGVTVGRVVGLGRRIGGAIGLRCRLDGEELLQQGLHLALHGCGSSYTSLLLHGLEQLTEVGVGVRGDAGG